LIVDHCAHGTMVTLRSFVSALAFALPLVTWGASARADNKADADRYFREGQALMEAGRFAEACPKLEQSLKLDTTLGSLLNLAFCYEKEGRVWQAWLSFKEAELRAQAAGQKDRAAFAKQRMSDLEKQLAKAVVKIKDGQPIDQLSIEDHHVPDGHKGTPFAVEPGLRKVTFFRRGKKPITKEIRFEKKGVQGIEVPANFEDADPEPVKVEPKVEPKAEPKVEPKAEPAMEPPSHVPAYVAFGVAGVGVAVGSVAGLMTYEAKDRALQAPTAKETESIKDEGSTTAMVSNVAFGVAGVGLVAGLYLFFSAKPSPKSSAAWVAPVVGTGTQGVAAGLRF
jgi:hypothetical protein